MAQITLNSTGVASNGSLVLQSNGTTAAVTIDTSQRVAFVAGTAALPAITTTGDTNTGIFFPAADTIAFAEGGAEVARFDSSGNFGLGVTPSAWNQNHAIDLGYSGANYASIAYRASNNGTIVANNLYLNSSDSWIYKNTAAAGLYQIIGGAHYWARAVSGTGGTSADSTLTTGMLLDASGNLGIGTTSPSSYGKLAVAAVGGTNFISMVDTANSNKYGRLVYDNDYFSYKPNSGTAAFTVDPSGNLLVGTTTVIGKITSDNTSTNANNGVFRSGVNSYTGNNLISSSYTAAGTGWNIFLGQSGDGSQVSNNCIFIYGNGNVANQNNSYGAISDIKLKENIVDATPKLDKLMQVRVRNYNLKGEYSQHKQLGVIAQELESIFPAMIEESPDRDLEGNDLGTMTKTVKYSVFVPMLIKAIQEQQALITQLTARITALESA